MLVDYCVTLNRLRK